MACSRDVPVNVERMTRLIGEAGGNRADVVVFPELAVTGAMADDILRADAAGLRDALTAVQSAARRHEIAVVFGMPHEGNGDQTGGIVKAAGLVRSVPVRAYPEVPAESQDIKTTPYGVTTSAPDAATPKARTGRRNSAFVVGPDGRLLTRYDQMVVDRPDLFEQGCDAKSIWFKVKGVPAIVTIGSDARWNEIGELAAVRGAQLLFNLSYGEDVSDAATLRRTQFWVQLASFCTFSATVNAADPQGLARPSLPANGNSAIWEDFDGHRKKPAGNCEVFSQYSACRVVSAGRQEKVLYATRTMPRLNPHYSRFVARRYPHLEPWYHLGAGIIGGDV
jgi:predicted amidohydrolase